MRLGPSQPALGLKNSAAVYQGFMDRMTSAGAFDFCASYIDDVVVHSRDLQTHLIHLQHVFLKAVAHGASISLEKCDFFCTDGLHPLSSRKDEHDRPTRLPGGVSTFRALPHSRHRSTGLEGRSIDQPRRFQGNPHNLRPVHSIPDSRALSRP